MSFIKNLHLENKMVKFIQRFAHTEVFDYEDLNDTIAELERFREEAEKLWKELTNRRS